MRYEPGDTIGPYRVTGLIGAGACGVVYQVVNSVTGRPEAAKLLANAYSEDLEEAQRFLQEIQLQARLNHPNIAQVRTAFCEGKTIVLIMEWVDGESLYSMLRRGPLDLRTSIRIISQVLKALGTAHQQGVVHRDVKPANILVDSHGVAKLTDFGLAKQFGDPAQANTGMAVGTAYYMAPEQVRGLAATDWRADLYSVGVVLYEMVTGHMPFEGIEPFAIMRAHVELYPQPATTVAPHLPLEFDAIIERALAKDPDVRFQSASSFLSALESLPIAPPPRKRKPWHMAAYATGIGALLLAAFALPPQGDIEPLDFQPPLPTVPEELIQPASKPVEPPPPPPPAPAAVRKAAVKPAPKAARPAPALKAAAVVPRPTPTAPPQQTLPKSTPSAEKPAGPPAPFRAIRIQSADPGAKAEAASPPASKSANDDNAAVTTPSRPGNWVRRAVTRVPVLFRRRNAHPAPEESR